MRFARLAQALIELPKVQKFARQPSFKVPYPGSPSLLILTQWTPPLLHFTANRGDALPVEVQFAEEHLRVIMAFCELCDFRAEAFQLPEIPIHVLQELLGLVAQVAFLPRHQRQGQHEHHADVSLRQAPAHLVDHAGVALAQFGLAHHVSPHTNNV